LERSTDYSSVCLLLNSSISNSDSRFSVDMNMIIAEAASNEDSDSRSPSATLRSRGFDIWDSDVQQRPSYNAPKLDGSRLEGPQAVDPPDSSTARTSGSPWRIQASRAPIKPFDLSAGPSSSASPTRTLSTSFTISQETVLHKHPVKPAESPLSTAAKHPSASHRLSTRPGLGPVFTPSRQEPPSAGPSSMRRVS
jgi:inhibitor of Bruton tyrosine kinase